MKKGVPDSFLMALPDACVAGATLVCAALHQPSTLDSGPRWAPSGCRLCPCFTLWHPWNQAALWSISSISLLETP